MITKIRHTALAADEAFLILANCAMSVATLLYEWYSNQRGLEDSLEPN